MKTLSRLQAQARIASLPALVGSASSSARALGFAPGRVGDVELAVEEAVANVCRHAGAGAPVELEVACLADEAVFVVEISDSGRPFDITLLPDPDVSASIEARPIGGLGVFLIKKISDALRYRREAGRNVLQIEFRRIAPP